MEHGAGDATAAGVLFERSLRVLGEAEIAVAAIGEDDELLTMTMDEKFVTSVDDSYGQAVGGKNKPPPGIETEVRVESAGSLRMAQAAVLSSWSQVLSRAGDCATARGYLVKAKGLDGNNVCVLHSLARCVLGLGTQIPLPCFISQLVTVCPYIAIYKTDTFFDLFQGWTSSRGTTPGRSRCTDTFCKKSTQATRTPV
jgi:hypothetical protein